jgi:hypothetical protein
MTPLLLSLSSTEPPKKAKKKKPLVVRFGTEGLIENGGTVEERYLNIMSSECGHSLRALYPRQWYTAEEMKDFLGLPTVKHVEYAIKSIQKHEPFIRAGKTLNKKRKRELGKMVTRYEFRSCAHVFQYCYPCDMYTLRYKRKWAEHRKKKAERKEGKPISNNKNKKVKNGIEKTNPVHVFKR